jgi:hypothetical protein
MSVAIATIDISALVNLQPDPGMAKRCWHIAATIAGDTGVTDTDNFWFIGHVPPLAKGAACRNMLYY